MLILQRSAPSAFFAAFQQDGPPTGTPSFSLLQSPTRRAGQIDLQVQNQRRSARDSLPRRFCRVRERRCPYPKRQCEPDGPMFDVVQTNEHSSSVSLWALPVDHREWHLDREHREQVRPNRSVRRTRDSSLQYAPRAQPGPTTYLAPATSKNVAQTTSQTNRARCTGWLRAPAVRLQRGTAPHLY